LAKETRANKAQIRLRIEEVKNFLLIGKTVGYIKRSLSEKYSVTERMVAEYVKVATAEINEINKDGAKNLLAKLVHNQWSLYVKALRAEDVGLCDKIIMNIAKLRGLDVQKVVHEMRELESASDDLLDEIEDEVARAQNYN
jgi:archaellum biogenesis ATPase FlaH